MQEVCNLLYGYGCMRYHHPLLMEAVAKACAPRLHEFSTQDLVLTIWSYGMVKHMPSDPAMLANACAVLQSRSQWLLPIQISIIMKGFAKIGYQPPTAFMAELANVALNKIQLFKPVELCQLLWGYAHLGYRDKALIEAIVSQAMYLLQTWGRPLKKATIDTIVFSCQLIGFWPQMLVDMAEMRGIYVRQNADSWNQAQNLEPLEIDGIGPPDATVMAADLQPHPSNTN